MRTILIVVASLLLVSCGDSNDSTIQFEEGGGVGEIEFEEGGGVGGQNSVTGGQNSATGGFNPGGTGVQNTGNTGVQNTGNTGIQNSCVPDDPDCN